MNYRFYTISSALLIFTGAASAANNAAWNCEQNKNGEWTCLNQTPAGNEPAQPQVIKATPTVEAKPKPPETIAQPPAILPVTPAPVQQAVKPVQEPEKVNVIEKVVEKAAVEPQKLRVKVTENQKPVLEKVEPKTATADASSGKVPGWTCKTGDDKSGWNCNLVGADPKGEAHVVADGGSSEAASSSWLTPTFDRRQERDFQTLRAEFDRDPWQSCEVWGGKKRKIKATSAEVRDAASTDINADFSEVFDGEVLNFAGNVDMVRADQHLIADKASYDTVAETLDAQGSVLYSEDQLAFSSETASLSLGKDEARLRKAQFIVAEAPFRGNADVVYRESKGLSRYNDAAFTSCAPGNQDWIVHASRMKINRDSGQGSAKNAWLEFKGVPVLYTPYISFPTDNRRLSGLLAPTWGNTQRNGFDFSVPFYWNIAPNFDDIVTPRYMTKRGEQLRNKFRYLTDMSRGTFAAEYMPNDQLVNKARYSASWKDQTSLLPGLSSLLDLNYVSDKTYFNDLNNALGFQNTSYLPSTALLSYGGAVAGTGVGLSVGAYHYQSVDKTIPDAAMPYDMLPRVNFNVARAFEGLPVTLAMTNEFTHFYHTDLVNGQRVNIAPSLSLPLESSAGYFIPRITGQYTQYQLSNQTLAGQPSSISRTLPIFSVSSGMNFEKDLNFGSSQYLHTLEPQAFYLYIPRKDQSNIPVFDTALYDTNFYSLFRENRFAGGDRVQDANQVTLAAVSRFIDSNTGLEPLKVSLGQIMYFQDRTVTMPGQPIETSNTSNFVGELSGQFSKHWSYMTGTQWDPEANGFARGQVALKYNMQPNQIVNLGYRYRRNPLDSLQTISQTDVSFRLPLFGEWYGFGRWQYSLNFDKTTESFIGVERENCCWRFRILGRRFINGANTVAFIDPSTKPETAFFVQLELKGLSSFGDNVDTFLQTNLKGYRKASYFE
ncbi:MULTISPECIES: LPS assembly protein LptD [Methylomonas]|uniref:LPS-assembly protein LptD n=2 Tax=Methylomonas TaxID=416 RepID=A0A126T0T5_9GAMM|nr:MULTISPECIES: LPS assembly protein LptD [Methylomonas]AMK75701.1 LPS biosynthesis protein [Methylomonas denitrificans]OAH98339.1 LPS biosynthesis protein [Methylomonas methanica]TCV82473.1 LPS-assembly protein [Methylomonas methanica]